MKKNYENPCIKVYTINPRNIVCTSPTAKRFKGFDEDDDEERI